jgi:RNA polymerase sigma-70 factor (ECF subfamily)
MKIFFRKHLSENEMVEGCVRGDESCQSLLYHRTCSKMYGVCVRYIKDRDKAEDVMQEGYLKVFKFINNFRWEGSFEAWMRKVFVSACLEELRKNTPEVWNEGIYENNLAYSEDLIMDRIAANELLEMVQSLPDGYRTVFNLYAIEGYSHKEIGEFLGISETTSKSQLSRARGLLKEKIELLNIVKISYAN